MNCKRKISKLAAWIIGGMISGCTLYGMAPFGIAYMAGTYMLFSERFVPFIIAAVFMFARMDSVLALKQCVSIVISLMISRFLKNNPDEGVKQEPVTYARAAAVVTFVVNIYYCMYNEVNTSDYAYAVIESLAVYSFAIVFEKGISYIYNGMRKNEKNGQKITSILIIAAITMYTFGMGRYMTGNVTVLVWSVFICIILLYSLKDVKREDMYDSSMYENGIIALKEKMLDMGRAFVELSNSCMEFPTDKSRLTKSDYTELNESISGEVCADCINAEHCWKNSYYDTYSATYSLIGAAQKNGTITIDDVPEGFGEKCVDINRFIRECNYLFKNARINMYWQNRLYESKKAVLDQLKETGNVIIQFSKDVYNGVNITPRHETRIRTALNARGMIVRELLVTESASGRMEISMRLKTEDHKCITTREVASYINDIMNNRRFVVAESSKRVINDTFSDIILEEDTNFTVLFGACSRNREDEMVSGDSFSYTTKENSKAVISIIDGMGAGDSASSDSRKVIELLEHFLETGFSEETAIKLINSAIAINEDGIRPIAVDLCVVDLYTGISNFVKFGAAATFLKRNGWIEVIQSTTLPVGAVGSPDIDKVSKKLYDGDIIIMVSDGILDRIENDAKEEYLKEIIMDIDTDNANEIAKTIIEKISECSELTIKDDMTVMAAGIWEK